MSDLARTVAAFSYEGVVFPGTDTSVKWGHDKATHQGYLQRGAVIETTGQRARVITVRVPLRNSLRWTGSATRLYPETYLQLREKLKQAEGFLTHPTYGSIVVHVDDVDENVDPLRPDGLDLTLTFTEQDALTQELDLSLGSAATPTDAALAYAAEADDAAAGLDLTTSTSLEATLGAAFDYLDEAPRTPAQAFARFGEIVADVTARMADPGAASTDGHLYRVALSRVLAASLRAREAYTDTEGAVETVTVPEAMSLARAAVLAYGDPRRAADLAARNRLLDPSLIPAGTVLVL